MQPGDVIAQRFEIEWRAGAGGMGEVYRALDRHTGKKVALKLLHQRASLEEERFAREAEVLSALDHPSIVRYLGHGQTALGTPYLAMEWLEGETLAERLERAGLTVAESLARADELLEPLEPAARAAQDPQGRARVLLTVATRALVRGDIERHQALATEAALQFGAVGDRRNAVRTRVPIGHGHNQLGLFAEAEQELREACATAERMGLPTVVAYAHHHLGFTLARRGELEEARSIEASALELCLEHGNARLAGVSGTYLALILAQMGELAAAEEAATTAIEALRASPPAEAYALSMRARIRLTQGRTGEALTDAGKAAKRLRELGGIEEGEALVRLTHAEAVRAEGDIEGAKAAIEEARSRLLGRAGKIAELALRRSFLEQVPENVRTLALAQEWLG